MHAPGRAEISRTRSRPSLRPGHPPGGLEPPLRLLSSQFFAAVALAVIAIWLAVGCGRSDLPPLGRVSGTITLNGVPLPAALVVFTPDGPGRSAQAVTDTAGRYELAYLRDIAGADLGSHTVRITTATEDRRGREILPSRYHRKTTLAALVEPGDNLIDFALESK